MFWRWSIDLGMAIERGSVFMTWVDGVCPGSHDRALTHGLEAPCYSRQVSSPGMGSEEVMARETSVGTLRTRRTWLTSISVCMMVEFRFSTE